MLVKTVYLNAPLCRKTEDIMRGRLGQYDNDPSYGMHLTIKVLNPERTIFQLRAQDKHRGSFNAALGRLIAFAPALVLRMI